MYCITKWCKVITDDHTDWYTGRLEKMKAKLMEKKGQIPPLYKFRLLDDDGVVYAYGFSTDDSDFDPLDDYMYAYGVVEIQYKNPKTGEYETL